eukprot:216987-Amphidinium_carterae.2
MKVVQTAGQLGISSFIVSKRTWQALNGRAAIYSGGLGAYAIFVYTLCNPSQEVRLTRKSSQSTPSFVALWNSM